MVYALIAGVGCFAIAWNQGRLAERTHSPLLKVDSKNWLIDGVLSVAVAVAFLVVVMLKGTSLDYLLPYTDPGIVIVLVLISLPIPAGIIRENWNQLLGRAPNSEFQKRTRDLVVSTLAPLPASQINLRMQEIGRFTYIQVYIVMPKREGQRSEDSMKLADEYRGSIFTVLSKEHTNLALDVILTRDFRWVGVSVGTRPDSVSKEPAESGSSSSAETAKENRQSRSLQSE